MTRGVRLLRALAREIDAACFADGVATDCSFAWLVENLTDTVPTDAPWPDQWLVDLDAMECAGWGDVTLKTDKRERFVPAWQAQWWRAFREWVVAGAEPDADVLDMWERKITALATGCTTASVEGVGGTAAREHGFTSAVDRVVAAVRDGVITRSEAQQILGFDSGPAFNL